jgi:hypothetical protein
VDVVMTRKILSPCRDSVTSTKITITKTTAAVVVLIAAVNLFLG